MITHGHLFHTPQHTTMCIGQWLSEKRQNGCSINTASAKFAGLASASAEARKIRLYAYPEEEVFSSTRVPIAFPQSSCDYGMMMPKRHFDGGSSLHLVQSTQAVVHHFYTEIRCHRHSGVAKTVYKRRMVTPVYVGMCPGGLPISLSNGHGAGNAPSKALIQAVLLKVV